MAPSIRSQLSIFAPLVAAGLAAIFGRQLNLVLSFAALVVIGFAFKLMWKYLSAARKVLWMGAATYPISVFYGNLEILYWPQLQVRVFLISMGMTLFLIGFVAEIRDAYARKLRP